MMRRSCGRVLQVAASVALASSLAACTVPEQVKPFVDPIVDLFVAPTVAEGRQAVAASYETQVPAESLIKAGTLTVGLLDSQTAPLLISSDQGAVSGMDVDIAAACALQMGLKVEYVSVASTSSLGTECDVVMGVEADQSRGYTVVGDYAESAIQFFHKGPTGVSQVEDLSSKTVGYQAGSTSQVALESTGLVMQGVPYFNINEIFDALASEQIDYALCNAYSGAYVATAYDDIYPAGTLSSPVAIGVAVSSENPVLSDALAAALQTVQTNGVGDIVRSRWIGGVPQLTAADQVQSVPEAVTVDETTASNATSNNSGDGSTAGSNAVTSI